MKSVSIFRFRRLTGCLLLMWQASGFAQNPTYDVYITNDTLTSFTTFEFDVMIKANGSTTTFNLKTFQAGLYVNPAFVATNTVIGCTTVSGTSQLAAPGYNGSYQWNNTDKVVNMGFNSSACASPTLVTTIPLRIARVRLIGFMGFGCGAPNLQFNYVPLPLPMLRLRTEVILWDTLCSSKTFYPPALGSQPTFNGELWTQTDADGRSPVSTNDNNSPAISVHPLSQFRCSGSSVTFNVTASSPLFPSGGTLSYQWQRNCGSGFTDIPLANASSYTLNPVTSGDNGCLFRCVVTYSCGGSINSNPATLTTLVATETHTAVSCNGGSSTVTISAVNGTPPYSGTGTFTQFVGTQLYTITDFNGCQASVSVTVTQPAVLTVSAGSNTPVCAGTPVNLSSTPAGGTSPYNYSWTGPSGFSSTSQSPVIALAAPANGGTYTVSVTDNNGCTSSATTSVSIINCTASLNLKFFIEAYYLGSSLMTQVLFNQGVDPNPLSTNVDTVIVELHDTNNTTTIVQTFKGVLQTNGTLICTFPGSVVGNTYWIAVKHRSAIQTWSALPHTFTVSGSYDFTTASANAYAGNVKDVYNEGIWSFYTGDVNQDESVDIFDSPQFDSDIQNFVFGYYNTDLNGDGSVDIFDSPPLDDNIQNFISAYHP